MSMPADYNVNTVYFLSYFFVSLVAEVRDKNNLVYSVFFEFIRFILNKFNSIV